MAQETMGPVEAAAYLHVHPQTVRRKALAGQLPAAKVGRKWLFRKVELDAWLAAGGTMSEEDRSLAEELARRAADPENAQRISWAQVKAEAGL